MGHQNPNITTNIVSPTSKASYTPSELKSLKADSISLIRKNLLEKKLERERE